MVGRNGVIALDVEGSKQNVILTDFQKDSLKNGFVHVDFLAVDMSKELTTEVRIVLIGESAGVKDGGVLQQSLHEVSISATPANIPQTMDIHVTNLQVAETITIADIKGNSQFSINHEEDEVVASILYLLVRKRKLVQVKNKKKVFLRILKVERQRATEES